MYLLKEYALQVVIAALQAVIIVYGTLTTAALLKAAGYPDFSKIHPNWWPVFPIFIRNWGFVILLVPALWVASTVWLEKSPNHSFDEGETLMTGGLVFGFLIFFYVFSALTSTPTGVLVQEVPG